MRNLDNLILSGQWEIEPFFALQTLAKYWYELELVEAGHPVDYSAARAALEPVILGAADLGRAGLSSRDIPKGSIAKLSLSGAMRLEDGLSSRGVRQLVSDIQEADENPQIGAILIEVNSGGGESIAGAELQNALEDVRRKKRTKTGAYAIQMASAAVRALLPVDFIFAASGNSFIGSIGTMLTVNKQVLEYTKSNLLEIYAKQSTQKNAEFRALLDGDLSPIQQLLTENNQVFLEEVQAYRKLRGTDEQKAEVLSGKLFTADVAMQRGLIDGIGTWGQAVERLQSMISTPENRGFYNSTNNNMKFSSIVAFLAALIPGLNSKYNLDLAEDASAEDVVNAVTGAKSLEDLKAEIKAELAAEQATAMTDLNTRMDELTARVETLQQENTALATQRDELTANVATLTAAQETWNKDRKDLETRVADLTGKRGNVAADGTSEDRNSDVPDTGKFKTTSEFYAELSPANGSKY